MNVSFDAEKKKVTKVEVTEQKETEGLGAKVADAEFLSQFEGVEAPVFLPGMSLEKEEKVSDEETFKRIKKTELMRQKQMLRTITGLQM